MSNGDSLDGFVFPPFIPPSAARAPEPPAPSPAPVAEQPPAAPQSGAGRATMPWDVETPIVRESADTVPEPAVDQAEDEDLPWLERPAPREPVAEAPAAAPTADDADDAFPDWLAWDDRAADEVRSDVSGVAPVEGLQELSPADELGGFITPPPAVEWAEAAPEPGEADSADALSSWSLDAPEAVEPPPVAASAPEVTFDTPAAAADAEPAFDIMLDDGVLTFAPAETEAAAEPAAPFVADAEAVIAAEPDPFSAAAVDEAEVPVVEPAPAVSVASAGGAFDEVAGRLEDIARTLRERPDDLLSGRASDPLALLVAGYVMGYGARR